MVLAVIADVVDVDATGALGAVGLLGVDEGDLGGATALGVLDGAAGSIAVVRLLADGVVGHGVVHLHAAVELGGDGVGVDGERVDTRVGAAAEGRGRGRVMATRSGDGPAITAVGAATAARPAVTEIETTPGAERSGLQTAPVPALTLPLVAVVVGVAGASVRLSIAELISPLWKRCQRSGRQEAGVEVLTLLPEARAGATAAAAAKIAKAFFMMEDSDKFQRMNSAIVSQCQLSCKRKKRPSG